MYEVGDKVVYQGADKSAYKKVGVLKSIEEKDGKPQLTVEFEGGETFTAPVDDWSKEFANAARNALGFEPQITDAQWTEAYKWFEANGYKVHASDEGGFSFAKPILGKQFYNEKDGWNLYKKLSQNACKNAKFKIGDKVKVVGKGLASKGWVGKVSKVQSGGWPYVVKFEGHDDGEYAEDEIVAANSATNASKGKVGDTVRVFQYPIYGKEGKIVKVGLMRYDVEVDGKVYPDIDYRRIGFGTNSRISTNSVVANAIAANRRVARNAAFKVIPAKDGNKLNDFIEYSYVDAEEKVQKGSIPYVRKDLLKGYIEKDMARLKNRLSSLNKHLEELAAL